MLFSNSTPSISNTTQETPSSHVWLRGSFLKDLPHFIVANNVIDFLPLKSVLMLLLMHDLSSMPEKYDFFLRAMILYHAKKRSERALHISLLNPIQVKIHQKFKNSSYFSNFSFHTKEATEKALHTFFLGTMPPAHFRNIGVHFSGNKTQLKVSSTITDHLREIERTCDAHPLDLLPLQTLIQDIDRIQEVSDTNEESQHAPEERSVELSMIRDIIALHGTLSLQRLIAMIDFHFRLTEEPLTISPAIFYWLQHEKLPSENFKHVLPKIKIEHEAGYPLLLDHLYLKKLIADQVPKNSLECFIKRKMISENIYTCVIKVGAELIKNEMNNREYKSDVDFDPDHQWIHKEYQPIAVGLAIISTLFLLLGCLYPSQHERQIFLYTAIAMLAIITSIPIFIQTRAYCRAHLENERPNLSDTVFSTVLWMVIAYPVLMIWLTSILTTLATKTYYFLADLRPLSSRAYVIDILQLLQAHGFYPSENDIALAQNTEHWDAGLVATLRGYRQHGLYRFEAPTESGIALVENTDLESQNSTQQPQG